jgi:hypothetical protein
MNGYVLAGTSKSIVLCGGKNTTSGFNTDFNTECHRLDSGMPWVAAPSLQTPDRRYAAAISFMGGMWVTGKNIKLTHHSNL